MNCAEDVLSVFLNAFTARDVADALPSCDEGTDGTLIRDVMDKHEIDLVGIRRAGVIDGWVGRTDLTEHSAPATRSIVPASVIADSAPLNAVVSGLTAFPQLFVRSFGQVGGFITRGSLERPAMRMWLFGLITVAEMRVNRIIGELLPGDQWQSLISPGRLQKARDLQQERRRRGQSPKLLDCLQFADKGDIVSRDDALRALTRFSSRRELETFIKALQDLRNNLAHSQELTGNWDVIVELATNLHRIVLGPPELKPGSSGACQGGGGA